MTGLSYPTFLAVDSEALYVPQLNGNVVRVDKGSGAVTTFASGLYRAIDVSSGAMTVYVVDLGSQFTPEADGSLRAVAK